jgi:acylphosphatase
VDKLHKNITVSGMVQGVGFRYECSRAARNMGINGFVKNLSDGNVYIEAEGTENQLLAFIKWCWRGSRHSKVSDIRMENGILKEFQFFEIK